jgi:hypothetical protein
LGVRGWEFGVGSSGLGVRGWEFGVRVKTGLSDGDRSIYLVTSFYSDPELAGLEPPEERTIEYEEEALRHFEGDL